MGTRPRRRGKRPCVPARRPVPRQLAAGARARLHVKYGTAPVAWFPWLATQVDWRPGSRVLEVGCGAGWMWAEAAARLPGELHLTLTDLSTGMVAEAVDRVGSLGRYRAPPGGWPTSRSCRSDRPRSTS